MITSINLRNFRSYDDSSFEFEPGVNIVVGPNASGKTNIIESIILAGSGTSYRGRDSNLVMHDKDWSRVEMIVSGDKRIVRLQRELDKIAKTIEIDEQKKVRMPKGKTIPSVLFEPNHLLMFHGGPDLRRDFMDGLLADLSPEFADARKQYMRALLQRNSLLRRDNLKKEDLFVWNLRLSDLGGVVAGFRVGLVDELNNALQDIYRQLSGSEAEITVTYLSKNRIDSYPTDMLKRLEDNLEIDMLRRHTTIGPHRDDFEVYINGHNIKEVASRGEIRTIILACKIFEQQQIEKTTGNKPLILLDDVFSELDGARRRALTAFLKDSQVFITTTDADVVVQHFMQECNVIALV